MKKSYVILFLACCLVIPAMAQTDSGKIYRNFPIIATIQFHSLALPFRDLKTNFSNVGFGLGTEVSLNGKHNWTQQVNMVWYRNQAAGNGLLFYTQTAWRPTIISPVYTEVKAGVGYLVAFRPVESYKQENGKWVSVDHKGKGLFTVPIGISIGYNKFSPNTYFSPFATYQLLLISGYNKSIPIVPQTLLQVGSRIHFNP